jgi:hypothetical protein
MLVESFLLNFYDTIDCHGRMIQEYDESKLHIQLKYLESLFDIPRKLEKLTKELSTRAASNDGYALGIVPFPHSIHTLALNHFTSPPSPIYL